MTAYSAIPEDPYAAVRFVMDHLSTASFSSISSLTVERAKDVVIDIAGCMIGGRSEAASGSICRLAGRWSGVDQGSASAARRVKTAPYAAFAGAFMARAFDFGVGGSSILSQSKPPVHISEALVPVALTMAARRNLSGPDFLTALIIGEDFTGRLASSLSYTQPLDCRGTVNTLGCAVTAAKAIGLDAQGFEHALFIALHQVGGIKQGIQFNLGQGFSAMLGVMAAELAEQGILGVSDPVKEAKILHDVFSSGFDRELFFDKLGQEFHTSVSFKPYACCRATHSSVECTLELLSQGLSRDNVRSITVHVSPWTKAHLVGRPFQLRENHHADAIFSLQYAVASTLIRGSCQALHYTEPYITDPAVGEMAARINLTTEGWPFQQGDPKLSAFLTAESCDGHTFLARCRFPRGHEQEGEPLSPAEKKKKFMENCELGGVEVREAEHLYTLLRNLDELTDLTELTEFLEC